MKLFGRRGAALAIASLVAADWTSKLLVANEVGLGFGLPVVPGWLWLEHRENPGISLGTLAGLADPWRTLLLASLSLFGIGMCTRLLVTSGDPRVGWAAALVLAGAVGNLGDRLLDGTVTDFIRVEHLPFVFNVADVAVAAGAALLVALLVLDPRARREAGAAQV